MFTNLITLDEGKLPNILLFESNENRFHEYD